ncbi:MAG: M17 family metallopeptidase [Thiotrichales bacterium]
MQLPDCYASADTDAIPLIALTEAQLSIWLAEQPDSVRAWCAANRFAARADSVLIVPDAAGVVSQALCGISEPAGTWSLAAASAALPPASYRPHAPGWSPAQHQAAALGWGLAAYRFERYKTARKVRSAQPRLVVEAAAVPDLISQLNALTRVRDLINTPADDLMPPELACEAKRLADQHGAEFRQIVGDALLGENYPAIHAVGRASAHAPRLIEFSWGESTAPRVALVGKGVCFDSGGLDIKSAGGMRLMQKDMGGAAHVLGLAELIMVARLPVRLQVLIPAVENAIAGNAFHPGDVLDTRAGKTVEIDNTDAEGRLILCDALTEACRHKPDLLLDFATLTGAARVAVGTEIAAFFANDRALAQAVLEAANAVDDPMWELPLHAGYRSLLESPVADLVNSTGNGGYAGAITAALFLEQFVTPETRWVHVDMMAWNTRARPGRPKGGEAMGVRALFTLLQARYAG